MELQDLFTVDINDVNSIKKIDFDTKTEHLKRDLVSYVKDFNPLECGIFKSVEFEETKAGAKALTFFGELSLDFPTIEDKLRDFANNLFNILGDDGYNNNFYVLDKFLKEIYNKDGECRVFNWNVGDRLYCFSVFAEDNLQCTVSFEICWQKHQEN